MAGSSNAQRALHDTLASSGALPEAKAALRAVVVQRLLGQQRQRRAVAAPEEDGDSDATALAIVVDFLKAAGHTKTLSILDAEREQLPDMSPGVLRQVRRGARLPLQPVPHTCGAVHRHCASRGRVPASLWI